MPMGKMRQADILNELYTCLNDVIGADKKEHIDCAMQRIAIFLDNAIWEKDKEIDALNENIESYKSIVADLEADNACLKCDNTLLSGKLREAIGLIDVLLGS